MENNEKLKAYNDEIPQQAKEAYNELANWYSARKRGSYEFKILLPAILNLLGNLRGKSLIDIGCGPCAYSAEFAKRGADVLGIDISQKMLEKAKDETEKENVKLALQKADAHSLPCTDNSFDIAVLMLTILDTKMVEEAARVLKPGGLLSFSDTHPIIEAKGRWENDKIGASLIIQDYFSEGKREWKIKHAPRRTIILKYHRRTIEQCVNMFSNAGFKISKIAEPKPGKDVKKSDPIHYDRCSRIPHFIIYLAQKRMQSRSSADEASAGL